METSKVLNKAALWALVGNEVLKLASCRAEIEVSEDVKSMKLCGSDTEYKVKSYRLALILCEDMKFSLSRSIDTDFLKDVSKFKLRFEPVETKRDGYILTLNEFDNIKPVEIDLNGRWIFDITDKLDIIKSLFPQLIFG